MGAAPPPAHTVGSEKRGGTGREQERENKREKHRQRGRERGGEGERRTGDYVGSFG